MNSLAASTSGIFISYRRADSPDATGRIYDRLVAEFGRVQVFKDIDSIPLGRDFRSHLNEMIGDCAAVLAVIGPHWADARDEVGKRRLEDADDFVRIELEAALARNIPVVPVLVSHALMPAAAQLPASLTQLAFRQSIEVRPDPDFHNDSTRLVTALRRIIDPNAPREDAASDMMAPATALAKMEAKLRRRSVLALSLATLAIVGMIAMAVPALRQLRQASPPEMRLDIVTPASSNPSGFALSPDGRQIVYVASENGRSRLWLRSLSSTAAVPLDGTEDAISPFWSPDGRSIGFHTTTAVKRLDLGAGTPRTLVAVNAGRGGTWDKDGVILIGGSASSGVLMRVSASGGTAEKVTTLGPQQTSHRWPVFLPDGRHFIYQALGAPDTAGIYLGTLEGATPVKLTASDGAGVYLPPGRLLWQNGRTLVARRLDLAGNALTGNPVTLAQDLDLPVGRSAASVASTGAIAYRSTTDRLGQLVWIDRSGAAQGTFSDFAGGAAPRFSPDGRRVVVNFSNDLWLLDGTRSTRFTFDSGKGNGRALWSPDGTRIAWEDAAGINVKLASGAGETEQFVAAVQGDRALNSWSPDGYFMLYHAADAVTGSDLWVLPMARSRTPTAWLRTRFNERSAALSPDGRWVAYASDASGRYEIYVRPFVPPGTAGANVDGAASQWQASTAGGISPAWRPDGKELYYLNSAGAMMAVPIRIAGATLEPGAPAELFPTRILGGGVGTGAGRQYDVAPDGRFLITTLSEATSAAPIT